MSFKVLILLYNLVYNQCIDRTVINRKYINSIVSGSVLLTVIVQTC